MRTVLHSGFLVIRCSRCLPPPRPARPARHAGPVARADRQCGRVITSSMMLDHVKALSADDKEGRAPGTVGEERTVGYLVASSSASDWRPAIRRHLCPGRARSSASPEGDGRVRREGRAHAADGARRSGGGIAAGIADVSVAKAPIVFVGYGVVAPIRVDDFKGVDVRARRLSCSRRSAGGGPGEPVGPRPKVFKGTALTYYGRWTYKYETAAKKGATAAIIVHETVLRVRLRRREASWGRENFGVAGPDEAAKHAPVDAWVTLDRAKALFSACGLDFDALKARAATARVQARAPRGNGELRGEEHIRSIVVEERDRQARWPGSGAQREYVMYSANWTASASPARSRATRFSMRRSTRLGHGHHAAMRRRSELEGGIETVDAASFADGRGVGDAGAKYYAEHPSGRSRRRWPTSTWTS